MINAKLAKYERESNKLLFVASEFAAKFLPLRNPHGY
jgi:hypothetical protein